MVKSVQTCFLCRVWEQLYAQFLEFPVFELES